MGFISDLLTNISAFRIKVGEKLNWLNANKADTTGNYPGLNVGKWGGETYAGHNVTNPLYFMATDSVGWGYSSIVQAQNILGLQNYAQLSQVYTQSQALALFVGKNGVETIADTKTFTSSPIVPNGTLSGHTVNLGQVNGFLGDIDLQQVATNGNITDKSLVIGETISTLGGNGSGIYIAANQGGGASITYNSNGNLDIKPRSGYNTLITEGNFGIGTINLNYKLNVDGDIGVNGNVVTSSYGASVNWFQAYNERVTQFNTTYTTSVYTFSILLANGVQKQTTLQVSSAHFVIGGAGGAGVLYLSDAIAQKISDAVTAADVTAMGYQNAAQVATEVSNQITVLGFAPESFAFFHGSPTIDTDKYREVIANYSGTGIADIDVINAQYGGVVLTVQAGDNQLNLSIDCLIGNSYVSGDEVLPGTATTYVFSDSLDVWIRRSMKMEF